MITLLQDLAIVVGMCFGWAVLAWVADYDVEGHRLARLRKWGHR